MHNASDSHALLGQAQDAIWQQYNPRPSQTDAAEGHQGYVPQPIFPEDQAQQYHAQRYSTAQVTELHTMEQGLWSQAQWRMWPGYQSPVPMPQAIYNPGQVASQFPLPSPSIDLYNSPAHHPWMPSTQSLESEAHQVYPQDADWVQNGRSDDAHPRPNIVGHNTQDTMLVDADDDTDDEHDELDSDAGELTATEELDDTDRDVEQEDDEDDWSTSSDEGIARLFSSPRPSLTDPATSPSSMPILNP